jgi:hypothetical protein
MSSTPETPDSHKRQLRRWIVIGVVIAVAVIVIAAAGTWYYIFGGDAPDAPTIDNALQQLLPSEPPQ